MSDPIEVKKYADHVPSSESSSSSSSSSMRSSLSSIPHTIMITNDDGPPDSIHSPFLMTFSRTLQSSLPSSLIFVCTPARQQSWTGKMITAASGGAIHDQMNTMKVRKNWTDQQDALRKIQLARDQALLTDDNQQDVALWSTINASPASTCNVGLCLINPFATNNKNNNNSSSSSSTSTASSSTSSSSPHSHPASSVDLVISGPNNGRNTGRSFMLSSGTIGAAVEATLHGVRSIALSFGYNDIKDKTDEVKLKKVCQLAVDIILHLYSKWPTSSHGSGIDLFSINIPLSIQLDNNNHTDENISPRILLTHAIQDNVGGLYRVMEEKHHDHGVDHDADTINSKSHSQHHDDHDHHPPPSSSSSLSTLPSSISPLSHSLSLSFHVDFSHSRSCSHNYIGSDFWAIQHGYVSITPLSAGLTECVHTHQELKEIYDIWPPASTIACGEV